MEIRGRGGKRPRPGSTRARRTHGHSAFRAIIRAPMARPPVPSDPSPARPLARALAWLEAHPRRAVAIAAVLPFLLTLGNPPVLDDGWAALDNPLVWSLRNVGRIFRELYGYAGNPTVRGPYRPITTLSYALDYAFHGRAVWGYHVVNVALHAGASLLVLAVARRLAAAAAPARAPRIALLAALLFAVHPAHVEALATIFGRTEPLSACFALSALVLALDWRRAWWRLPAAVAVLTLGVLSKEVAVVTPGLLAVLAFAAPGAAGLDARPGLLTAAGRRALGQVAGICALLLLSIVPYLLVRGVNVGVTPEARWFPVGTPGTHVALTMSRVLGEYLRILTFPSFLGGDFAYAARLPTLTAPTPGFWLATVAWAATLVAALWLLLRGPARLAGAGVVCTFLPLLPVLQLVPVGVLLAERLLYLPSVGFCLAAGALLGGEAARDAAAGRGRRGRDEAPAGAARHAAWAAGIAAAVLGALTLRTVVRTLDWTSARALWESELAKAPDQVVVNNNLALAYTAEGKLDLARDRLEVALRVMPTYWRAHVNLGIVEQKRGDLASALRHFAAAAALERFDSSPQFFSGWALEQAGRLEEAVPRYRDAVRRQPEDPRNRLYLGRVLARLGRTAEARAELEAAARLDPGDAQLREELTRLGAG
jgi:protein O-mannosyl-transferase